MTKPYKNTIIRVPNSLNLGTNMTELEFSRVYTSTELNLLGFSSNALTDLIRNKKITRVQRGFYALRREDDLLTIIQMFPEGILCLESAMYYHGYLSEIPEIWPIAVGKNNNRNKYSHSTLPLKAYFRDDKYIRLGVMRGEYKDNLCYVYNKERLICDCIRRKDLLSEATYRCAMQKYAADPDKDLERLMEYARELRIEKKVKLLVDSFL